MSQLVIIIPSVTKKIDMKKAKQVIKDYVGTRLIDTDEENMPGFVLKENLSKEDKKYLQNTISPDNENGCLAFIACDDVSSSAYLNATLIDED